MYICMYVCTQGPKIKLVIKKTNRVVQVNTSDHSNLSLDQGGYFRDNFIPEH